MKKKIYYIIFIVVLVVVCAVTTAIIVLNDVDNIIAGFNNFNIAFLFVGIGIVLITSFIGSFALTATTRIFYPKYRVYRGFFNSMIGGFFSAITPSATGGQVGQVFVFAKQGIKTEHSLSVLLINFIVYQISLILVAGITLLLSINYSDIYKSSANLDFYGLNFIFLALIGFAINVFVMILLYLGAFSKLFHRFVTGTLTNILHKLHIVKDKEAYRLKITTRAETFRKDIKIMQQNIFLFIRIIIYSSIKLAGTYAVPYFIWLGLGIPVPDGMTYAKLFFETFTLAAFTYLVTSFIPIPGASGGAEALFIGMFGAMFASIGINKYISSLVILWRVITFYFALIFGLLVFLSYRARGKDKESNTVEINKENLEAISDN